MRIKKKKRENRENRKKNVQQLQEKRERCNLIAKKVTVNPVDVPVKLANGQIVDSHA